ncbi:MAG: Clp protease ClpP, partial [Mesorhizobium sp.]
MTHRLLVGGEVVLYGDVGDMWGDGSGFTGRDVVEALAEHGKGPVSVRLNSGGGFVFEGVAIFNALKAHGDVTVYVDGLAASAASVIAMAGDKIVMRDGALIMIHDPSGVTIGNAEDHRETADTLDKLGSIIAGIYSHKTGIDAAEMRAMMLTETWLDAEEAVEFGFASDR